MQKTREQLLGESYLNITEIQTLLRISKPKARKIWLIAIKKDREYLGDYLLYENKARIETVLSVVGKSYNLLAKQIKNAPAVAEHSAIIQ